MLIYKCDKCGGIAERARGKRSTLSPTGWYNLQHGNYSSGVEYHICPECRTAMGIPVDYGKSEAFVGDQLIELIGEIVSEQMQSH